MPARAVSDPALPPTHERASLQVHSVRHNLEMVWPHTHAIAAAVVNDEAGAVRERFGDRLHEELVCPPMSKDHAACGVG